MSTAIIADDEDLPRTELRRMLQQHWPELKIIAECEHGQDALEAIHTQQPDIAFLDIRMPGMSGLDVAHAVNGPLSGAVYYGLR
ncbi:MAG: response regulator [Burkholderiales bacterium]|nr:response regulator [Burkholderiales bacterium]